MAMTLRLSSSLDEKLTKLTQETGRSKSSYLIEALENYLENREDILTANAVIERIKSGQERTYSASEVRNALKMERNLR